METIQLGLTIIIMAVLTDILNKSLIKTILYFELECNDADGGAISPDTGNYVWKCVQGKYFCVHSWYHEKCAKSCGRCNKGKEICTVRTC